MAKRSKKALLKICMGKPVHEIQALLDGEEDVHQADCEGKTLLMLSVIIGHETVFTWLLQRGVHLDKKDKHGNTALQYALINSNEAFVKALIDKGADIDSQNRLGSTPLHTGVMGNVGVQLLLSRGCRMNEKDSGGNTPLHLAIMKRNRDIVYELLHKGADLNVKNNIGQTPLHLASTRALLEETSLLVEAGADVNVQDNHGCTALYLALANGDIHFTTTLSSEILNCFEAIAKLLLQKNAEVNLQNVDGNTALHLAIARRKNSCNDLLAESDDQDKRTSGNGASLVFDPNLGYEVLFDCTHNGKMDGFIAQNIDPNIGEIIERIFAVNGETDVKNKHGKTPLHIAADIGCSEIVEQLLRRGANINVKDINYMTPLHFACATKNNRLVRELIAQGSEVNVKSSNGITPLHVAAKLGDEHNVMVLLENGANVNEQSKNNNSVLHFTCDSGNAAIAKLLLTTVVQADVGRRSNFPDGCFNGINSKNVEGNTPLHVAAKKGCVGLVDCLLANGAVVNVKNKEESTPLHFAASVNNIALVESLLKNGADPNVFDIHVNTPLHVAINARNVGTAKKLVEYGSTLKHIDNNGCTILHNSVQTLESELVELFAREESLLNVTDHIGQTPLHLAVRLKFASACELLMKMGAKSNIKDMEGNSPLHFAIRTNNSNIIKILLDNGAEINDKNLNGETPLLLSMEHCIEDIFELLIDSGAAVDVVDNDQNTPLHFCIARKNIIAARKVIHKNRKAVFCKNDKGRTALHIAFEKLVYSNTTMTLAMVKLMLEAEADVNSKDFTGVTPLDLAARNHNAYSMVEMLLDWAAPEYGDSLGNSINYTHMEPFKKHFTKLEAGGFPLPLLGDHYFLLFNLDYHVLCKKELEKLKATKLGQNTLYQVFSRKYIHSLLFNDKLDEAIHSDSLEDEYPIYAALLKKTYPQVKHSGAILNLAAQASSVFLPFPLEVRREVLTYLDVQDLQHVTDACRNGCVVSNRCSMWNFCVII